MTLLHFGSISRKLAMLVIIAVLPALLILLDNGLEQRRRSVESAKQDIRLIVRAMAQVQEDITRSSKQLLSTLALLPEVQNLDVASLGDIFKAVMQQNPDYQNFTLTDLSGMVLVSGLPAKPVSLADRKHVREALTTRKFSAGEYILTRVGVERPAFAYAYPVLDSEGKLSAVLTTSVKLDQFARYYELSKLPEKSFVSVTDHRGIRLYYYPPQKQTNPVGSPIRKASWDITLRTGQAGMFSGVGSDGTERIFSFEALRLSEDAEPYIYMWVGIAKAHILKKATASLIRNFLLMFFGMILSLIIAWLIGRNTFIKPIKSLVRMTRKFAEGDLQARSEVAGANDELGMLTEAFHEMAETLLLNKQTLQENEARFRLVMDSLDSMVYVADMDTFEVLFINAYGKKRLGDITGQLCWQSLQKGQRGPCPFCTNKYLLDEEGNSTGVYNWEMQNTVTGEWHDIKDRAIHWVDGRKVRLELATDITQRKEMENRLAEETERLLVTLRSIGDGVITTDIDGRVVLINEVAEHLTGWKSDEAFGRNLSDVFNIVDGYSRQPRQNPVEKVLASGEIVELAQQTLLISKNGDERNIADSGAPIRDKNGETIGIVLVFRDVTSELRTEQELIKVKKLESIGVLAGGIAHDFNNILVGILGNLDLALLDTSISEKTRLFLQESLNASYRARELTQQLLTFAKGGEPIKETSSLAEIVRDSANFILSGDKVSCLFNISEDLPLVDIDKGQISQVIQNIILNASQAMPDGGEIEVSCEIVNTNEVPELLKIFEQNVVKIVVRDSGVGIPGTILDKIFDPYFSTKKKGSGLGLAISHSIVQKHNGHIAAESSPGTGTVFTVYLPGATRIVKPQIDPAEDNKILKKCRILVMDDEEIVRQVVVKMLAQDGHEVWSSKEGHEAVEMYKDFLQRGLPFDVVIMDLTVPGGMGGVEAAKLLLDVDQDARIIASSGYSTDPVMANAREHGFSLSISKPYRLAELKKKINELIV